MTQSGRHSQSWDTEARDNDNTTHALGHDNRFHDCLLVGCWFFGAFDPPKPAPAPVVPEKQILVELTPEQKAEKAARKAEEDIENANLLGTSLS